MQYSLFVSKECGSTPRLDSSQTTASADTGQHGMDSQPSHRLEAMCVRMNSLDFAASKVEEFASQLEPAFGIDLDTSSVTDRPFAGSIEVAKKCRGEAVDMIGAHIVFSWLQPVYAALFVPTPEASRVDIVSSQLQF